MGARLKYAKVIDKELFMRTGSAIKPSLENRVQLLGEAPAKARAFEVHRNWYDFNGSFTETWRIQDPHGRTLYEGLEREVVDDNMDIVDEVVDVEFDYADTGYQLVLEVDGREVARADFEVSDGERADGEAP